MTVIGIIGSRKRNSTEDFRKVEDALLKILTVGDRLVSGGCPHGADRFAETLAKKYGLTITIHYPDWNGIGKGAGFARNSKIADDADILIACVSPDRTGGTEDAIQKFLGKSRESNYNLCLVR